jgi:hypothetical protein
MGEMRMGYLKIEALKIRGWFKLKILKWVDQDSPHYAYYFNYNPCRKNDDRLAYEITTK